ncbi:AraC family transcriptional regulator [Leptospira semungkisensis]|uniref:AraC family transcriptional regulator n=1 Tax=Leptospira semungkisensis TaxID=2484985 RepID=A0A4V3JB59_9LEPT|nr:AraC family transcriptional regulator [Leptospira semungkisensis]TGK01029.1 AraC family transcriptional regulator [Leptospira semungkisensis]
MGSRYTRILLLAIAAIAVFGTSNKVSAVSPDQTNLAILIDENKINLKFINICVSNLAPPLEEGAGPKPQAGTPTAAENAQAGQKPTGTAPAGQEELYKKLNSIDNYRSFKKANQADFNGNMWYFQSNYSLSYKNLKAAQGEMKDIFQVVHENYIRTARVLLEAASPMIIRSNDKIAQHLLKLGFRDLKSSEDNFTTAYNSSPYQFRVKLVLFGEGIKIARRARRFALLAMIAAKTPNDDKHEFQFVNLDEVRNAAEKENISDYDRIRNTLIDYIDNELLTPKISPPGEGKDNPVDLLEVHDDNYSFITNARVSFLEKSNEEIRIDDINRKESLPPVPAQTGGASN